MKPRVMSAHPGEHREWIVQWRDRTWWHGSWRGAITHALEIAEREGWSDAIRR
jgi:hypothetical protein